MYCIVPLAGPDFTNPKYGIKPLFKIDGIPLVEKALTSRHWYQNGELKNDQIIFVLREVAEAKEAEDFLKSKFPGCQFVKIADLTKGALLSSLAGASLIKDFTQPIIVDLIDMLYSSTLSPREIFQKDTQIGGILPYFKSDNEKYSYLEIIDNQVTQAVEKRVISDNASAGTYFFRNFPIFLSAVSDSVKFDKLYAFKNNLFLCPAFNGIVKQSLKIEAIPVQEVEEVSLFFK